jgi:hypothetical protein
VVAVCERRIAAGEILSAADVKQAGIDSRVEACGKKGPRPPGGAGKRGCLGVRLSGSRGTIMATAARP